MLSRFDHWVGKTLFVPLIIRACQTTGITQQAFYRYGWAVAAIAIGARLTFTGWGAVFDSFMLLVSIGLLASAALAPDRPLDRGIGFLRKLMLVVTILGVITSVLILAAGDAFQARWIWGTIYDFAVLFAEYAATITTIPPRESKRAVTAKAVRDAA